ncbi:MAG: choice-of-anchor J domain-containing protein [Chryseolinea sp.]
MIALVVVSASLVAQDRCGVIEYKKLLQNQGTVKEDTKQFEEWIYRKMQDKLRRSNDGRTQATLQVPVVVHVIHNGEAIGTGKNIPDAQVISQISVLNKDYKRLNDDASQTPTEFLPVASSFDVEFVLAMQDPEGLASSGIVRVKGSKTSWTMSDNYELKSQSYWPAEDYLNIWVCNLTDFLGYSQFPVSGLPGLENSSTNRLTDGVVIAFSAFGSVDDGAFTLINAYNKGRTATHEIGHFFGLNHIWGDDDNACTGTDYVDDTPNQAGSTGGCPTHPHVTCDVNSMFQNYLDYTNDNCMNLFTAGQVSRMQTVIQNSPRRASLPTSHGLNAPVPFANDAGIKSIVIPGTGLCAGNFLPAIEVRNYGSNDISTTRIQIKKDGVVTETKNFTFSPALTPLESGSVMFTPTSFTSGTHNVAFQVLLTNGVTDGLTSNNTLSQTVDVPQIITLPFLQDFTALPASWKVYNPDQNLTWHLESTNNGTNTSLAMDLFNYEDHVGEIDAVTTPVFNLSTAPAALLKFDVAYSRFESSNDGLKVVLLSNCNTDIGLGTVIYSKFGSSLATTSASSSGFVPTGPDEWRTEVIDLSAYAGQRNFQLAFVSYNDWGNNIFIDNIGLTASAIHDVVLKKIISPSPVTCDDHSPITVRIANAGTLISSLKVLTTVNGVTSTQVLTNLNLVGNTERDINLNPTALTRTDNDIKVELTEPDGDIDFFPDNNTLSVITVLNTASDIIPLRQDFSGSFQDAWTITNPHGGKVWEAIPVLNNTALYVNDYDNTQKGDMAWLVSPTLDFTAATEASLHFEQSYAGRVGKLDRFYILASLDCGNTFGDTLYTAAGANLSGGRASNDRWKPTSDADWDKREISLTSLVNNSEVRIAFVFVNDQGNNFYIDNIEFFVSEDPMEINEPLAIYPNPVVDETTNITFNLPERKNVTLDIVDAVGRVMTTQQLSNVLNQTYPVSLPYAPTGIYFVKVITDNKVYVRKLIRRK